jgi:hypothetical protein
MAPEGERKLVVDTCQDRNEVRFEGLYGLLCLIASVIAGGDQFELYLLPAKVLLERIRRFVIQRVLFIPSPAILILLIIFSYAHIISSFVRLRIGSTKMSFASRWMATIMYLLPRWDVNGNAPV